MLLVCLVLVAHRVMSRITPHGLLGLPLILAETPLSAATVATAIPQLLAVVFLVTVASLILVAVLTSSCPTRATEWRWMPSFPVHGHQMKRRRSSHRV